MDLSDLDSDGMLSLKKSSNCVSPLKFSSSSSIGRMSECVGGQISSKDLSHKKTSLMTNSHGESLNLNLRSRDQENTAKGGLERFFDDVFKQIISLLRVFIDFDRILQILLDDVQSRFDNILFLAFSALLPAKKANNGKANPIAITSSFRRKIPSSLLDRMQDENDIEEHDELLSPTRVTLASSFDTKDEWGHFAHFQEDFADEDLVASPFALQPKVNLCTLEETEEEADEVEME